MLHVMGSFLVMLIVLHAMVEMINSALSSWMAATSSSRITTTTTITTMKRYFSPPPLRVQAKDIVIFLASHVENGRLR